MTRASPAAAVAVLGVLFTVWAGASTTGPGDETQNARFRAAILDNLVHVRSDAQTGFGLIIGRRDGRLWIATAAHLVYQPPWDDYKPFKAITVRLKDSLDHQPIVSGPASGSTRVDVALIAVQAPPLGFFVTAIVAPPPATAQEVWLGGISGGRFEYHSTVGKFDRVDAGQGLYSIKELHGLPTSSGGIAVTRAGVIGLYIGGAGGTVVPIQAVEKAAFDRNVPFDLVDSSIRLGGTLNLCVVNGGPENVKLHLMADKRYDLDSQGCVHGPAQPYRVVPDDLNVVCRPSPLTPMPPRARFHLTCEPRLSGFWQSSLGGVEIKEADNGLFSFAGLELSRGGAVQGELRGSPSALMFLGKSVSGHMVTGGLVAERRRISGTLNFVDGAQSVDLTR